MLPWSLHTDSTPSPILSAWLSGLTQPAAHLICWTILCMCSGFCVCVCVPTDTCAVLLPSPTPPLHQMTRAVWPPPHSLLAIFFTPSQLRPQRNLLIESPTKSSIHQRDTLANTLTASFHFQSKHTQDRQWVGLNLGGRYVEELLSCFTLYMDPKCINYRKLSVTAVSNQALWWLRMSLWGFTTCASCE